ncbi:type III secretion system stalk subunit SctO [Acanthopleuribacter pedis]|uniref:YscO family type III secretion system apparatus protein n=1 Tax=Acanthopleuribacter pedis TaxID=442870 RepID=A0A8J7U8I9_9BACT|nr:YscO family type III secretion system apparatus protein [Acanthopleuribacter pedis]MBO1322596.1 YscO family type III secretion system apparatus protein [Acanthopleuribacter pedis]
MIKYVLQDLLNIRNMREDEAQQGITVAKYKVEEAARAIQDKIKEKEEYVAWRLKREIELYDGIKGKKVKLRDLDDLKERIFMLRQRDLAFEKAIEDAKRAKVDAEKAVEVAIQKHKAAIKERQKIDEHKKIWLEEKLAEENDKQEKEAEDFTKRKDEDNPDDDDDDADEDWLSNDW